jgi:hypothetical protein
LVEQFETRSAQPNKCDVLFLFFSAVTLFPTAPPYRSCCREAFEAIKIVLLVAFVLVAN